MAERLATEGRTSPLPGGYGWYYFDAISLDGRYVLIASWHTGFLFSPGYYDEVLDLRDREWIQPGEGGDLADPTNYGAFCFGLYDRGRTEAYIILEGPLVRGGADAWFSNLHAGQPGLAPGLPAEGFTLGVGENRVRRNTDETFDLEFADRSKWLRTVVEGSLKIRPLTPGSSVIRLAEDQAPGIGALHEWQIVASRAEVTGRLRWTDPIWRRNHELDFQGLGFIDRNAGRLPVSPSASRWLWGRFQGSERTIAYYRLDPPEASLESGKAGRPEEGERQDFLFYGDRSGVERIEGGTIEAARVRRNRWGMPHPLEIRGEGGGRTWRAEVVRDIDRGPFSVRALSRLSCDDPSLDGVLGITECYLPARWDVPLFRLLTRGRISRGA